MIHNKGLVPCQTRPERYEPLAPQGATPLQTRMLGKEYVSLEPTVKIVKVNGSPQRCKNQRA